jgi:mono/diheme cytochrome c family protein
MTRTYSQQSLAFVGTCVCILVLTLRQFLSSSESASAIGAPETSAHDDSAQSGAGASPATFLPDDAAHTQTIAPFLNQHCLKCHGPDVQEAGFRVDRQLPNDFLTRSVAEKWSEVLHRLNRGDMPPKAEPRPAVEEVAGVVDWITHERLRGEKARRGTEIVLRRLNRAEYDNTIRELTGIDMRPADEFPSDPPAGGFDNNGGALAMTPVQLELYVKVARQVLDRAIVTELERPPSIKWRFQIEEGFPEGLPPGVVPGDHYVKFDGRRMSVNPGCNSRRGEMTVLRQPAWNSCGDARVSGLKLPVPGQYVVRFHAAAVVPSPEEVLRVAVEAHERITDEEAKHIDNPQQRREFRDNFEKHGREQVRRQYSVRHYRYGPPRLKVTSQQSGSDRMLAEFDVTAPADKPADYEVRAWFDPDGDGADITFNNVYHLPRHLSNLRIPGGFPRPELLVDWVEVEGPLYDSRPPSSHRRILIDSPHQARKDEAYARDVLAQFMRRAYRRPLRPGEVDSKLGLFRNARSEGSTFEEAIKRPLTAVLSSPHFLFLAEAGGPEDANAPRRLNGFELAARLSYFLWSSMPDEDLARLAEEGKLDELQQLASLADRLLADVRSEALVKNFAGQWLKLRDVGANPPAKMIYLEYDDHLESSMRGETEAFFAHILRHDLSVMNFLRSDFVTINERMARFYGIPDVKGDHFRPVNVPASMMRGGLVTQASVLAVTSNGTRTSPVWRGVWILERLLGDPPSPPPPNAGDIPPKVPGIDKATVRERLRIHREQPQCAHCHGKIDPLGFALENFDASGQWREREAFGSNSDTGPNDPPIDARARLPGGEEFVGVDGLRSELLERQDDFLRCLAEKLYTYALGRELGYADEPTIADAVRHMSRNGYTLRSLIHHIVSSEAFRTR